MKSYFRHQIETLIYPLFACIGLAVCLMFAAPASGNVIPYYGEDIENTGCHPPLRCESDRSGIYEKNRCWVGHEAFLSPDIIPFWHDVKMEKPYCDLRGSYSPEADYFSNLDSTEAS